MNRKNKNSMRGFMNVDYWLYHNLLVAFAEAAEPPLEVVKREWKAFAGFVACLAVLFVAMLAPQTFMMLIAVVLVLATIIILYMLKTGDLQKMLNKKAEPDKEPEQKEDKGEVKQ